MSHLRPGPIAVVGHVQWRDGNAVSIAWKGTLTSGFIQVEIRRILAGFGGCKSFRVHKFLNKKYHEFTEAFLDFDGLACVVCQ